MDELLGLLSAPSAPDWGADNQGVVGEGPSEEMGGSTLMRLGDAIVSC